MAAEFVSKDQFGEFVKRMELGFHNADQRHSDLLATMNQRFEQADQRHSDLLATMNQRHSELLAAMDQRFKQADQRHSDLLAAMNQRFDQVDERFVDMKTDIAGMRADQRQMRSWIIGVYGLVVFGFLGGFVLAFLKDKLF